jgi:hypothetical protein
MSADDTQTSLDDFLAEVREQEKTTHGSGEYEQRETLKADRNVLYRNYILERFNRREEGQYGPSTALNMTSPEGEKIVMWVGGFEENHFNAFIERCKSEGHDLPLKVSFARTQQTSEKSGRTYNKLNIKLEDSGEDVQIELDNL